MRLTSSLFVSALIRRCFIEDAAAVVLRRGAEEAGTIFIVVDRLDGSQDLYGPAPQTAFEGKAGPERLFQRLMERAAEADVAGRLERERRFDPDLWAVAIEDRRGRVFVDVVPE